MPAPRATDEFFAPMKELPKGVEIYLGIIHAADDIAGARKRIELARKYVPEFGISTECRFARARKPDLVRNLIDIHAAAANEPG